MHKAHAVKPRTTWDSKSGRIPNSGYIYYKSVPYAYLYEFCESGENNAANCHPQKQLCSAAAIMMIGGIWRM